MNPCSKCGVNERRRTHSWCQPCLTASNRDWQRRVGRRRTRYGLSHEDIAAMRLMQGGRCEICAAPLRESEHVDHDHASGQVRALLCSSCNQGLGNFKDDAPRLVAAARYLERWQ